ncbi:MAG TPA: phosphotransferase [Methylophaga sp.]|nr:phosphotransferase [Methylophaga sp.]
MSVLEDQRYLQIQQWLQGIFAGQQFTVTSASSDASFRRYFRVNTTDDSWIIMDAPPAHENIEPFIRIGKLLAAHDLPVPVIFQQNLELGFLLLSDLGNTSFLSMLNQNSVQGLYKQAIDGIVQMQLISKPTDLPAYDAALLGNELALFDQWFLGRHLGLDKPDFVDDLYAFLICEAQQQPQAFVHRDYHSRNLMLQPDGSPGIIDFQDAVWGPVTYDLVSLLRDVYIQWPQSLVLNFLSYYRQQAIQHHIFDESVTMPQIQRWFDLMGLQRHLKILGIFCRLNYRDNKPNYLNDLALTLNYVYEVCSQYSELTELHEYLQQPAIKDRIL